MYVRISSVVANVSNISQFDSYLETIRRYTMFRSRLFKVVAGMVLAAGQQAVTDVAPVYNRGQYHVPMTWRGTWMYKMKHHRFGDDILTVCVFLGGCLFGWLI